MAAIATAKRTVEDRLSYFRNLIANKKKADESFHLEESMTLKDGGRLVHLQTPEGSVFHLVNGERWLYLENAEGVKILYVCELDENGQQKINCTTTLLK